jgi:hypothetical protein
MPSPLEAAGAPLCCSPVDPEDDERDQVPTIRAICRLAAASAFRDRAGTRLREQYGPDSMHSKQLKAAIRSAYDASLAYRLLYNLRNYAQHHDSPLSVIPMHGEQQIAGEISFTVSLVFESQGDAAQQRDSKKLSPGAQPSI